MNGQKRVITSGKGDDSGTIDSMIKWLKKAKSEGATHYQFTWSKDPIWSFKWIEAFKILSEEEVTLEKIKALELELENLRK